MARLEKFRGTDSLPGGRRPQVVADTAVGAATQNLGSQIRQSAAQVGRLGQLLAKRQGQIDALELDRARRRFEAGLRQKETQERQARQPGAAGFTETMLGHFETDGRAAVAEQPDRLQGRLAGDLERQRDLLADRFAALEYEDNLQYFRDGLAEALQAQVAKIGEDPTSVETGLAAMAALLESSPLGRRERQDLERTSENALGEAWIKSQPLQRRLDLMDRLRAGGEIGADPGLPGPVSALPSPTLARLRVEAQDALTASEFRETAELTARIVSERSGFDPQQITTSRVLSPERRTQLAALLAEEVRQEEEDLEALDWARGPMPGNPNSQDDRRLADRAYRRLITKGTDPDSAAQTLLRHKGVLPKAHARGLLNQVRSRDLDRVRGGFERLAALSGIGATSFQGAAEDRQLRDSLAKWRILIEVGGHDKDEAARKLAGANDPASRDRLSERAAQIPDSDTRTVLDLLASQPVIDGLG